jgi:hypothetical protein
VRTRVLSIVALVLVGPGTADAQIVYPSAGGAAPGVVAPPLITPIRAALVPVGADGVDGVLGVDAQDPDPVLGALFAPNGGMRIEIGFEYLRPYYSNGATTLVIPPTAQRSFPVGGSFGDLTNNFAFVPQFGIKYTFGNNGFGLGASGQLFTIQGDLRRTVTGPEGSGILSANNSISIGSANVLEGLFPRWDLGKMECFRDTPFEALSLLGSFGGRYSYVHQGFNASVTTGPNLASLAATQDYNGFGFTGALGALYPLGHETGLALYGLSRGSLLVGRNLRTSTFATVVTDGSGASSSGQVSESKTVLIPVGEFELGVSWGLPINRRAGSAGDRPQPFTWIRAGAVVQVWGGLGLLPPPINSPIQGGLLGTSNSPLVLVGFTVMAGVSF